MYGTAAAVSGDDVFKWYATIMHYMPMGRETH